jgi:endonuclease/exonuclease/phosphatase family metal-dependent hydrolase
MRVFSFNIHFRNPNHDRIVDFIRSSDFDVFCLQEVPDALLERFKREFHHVASAPEMSREHRGVVTTQHVVTISKHPIIAVTPIPFGDATITYLRAKFIIGILYMLGMWGRSSGERNILQVDLETPHSTVRVYNIHLLVEYPAQRLRGVRKALADRDKSIPTIVCGDFNTIEFPKISLLNWLYGGTVGDVIFYKRERRTIERMFSEYGLSNPLVGSVTHPLAHSQLDHILISKDLTAKSAHVIHDRIGSDHYPIFVETN